MKNTDTPAQEPAPRKPNFFLELLFTEGGFSTLIVLPIVIYYFFSLAV